MSVKKVEKSIKRTKYFCRTIDSNLVSPFAAFHWLNLAFKDFINAPLISLTYGIIFSLIPITICYLVIFTETHLVILPSTVAFAFIL